MSEIPEEPSESGSRSTINNNTNTASLNLNTKTRYKRESSAPKFSPIEQIIQNGGQRPLQWMEGPHSMA